MRCCYEAFSNRHGMENWQLKLTVESILDIINSSEFSLSFRPWRIRYETLKAAADDSLSTVKAIVDTVTCIDGSGANSTITPTATIIQSFPSISYLDLRRQQNIEFSNDKCREAEAIVFSSSQSGSGSSIDNVATVDIIKAKTLYKQALELVPNHLQSLIGYAKLLMTKTETYYKAERTLKNALDVDPNNVEVQQYITTLQDKRQRQRRPIMLQSEQESKQRRLIILANNNSNNYKQKDIITRKSSAYQDALMERALLDPQQDDEYNNNNNDKNKDDEEFENSYRKSNRSKKKKKKKDKKRHHKRERSHRKRKKEKKHRKRSSRRYDSSSSSSSSSSSLLSSSSSEISTTPLQKPINCEHDEKESNRIIIKTNSPQEKKSPSSKNRQEPTFSPPSSTTKQRLHVPPPNSDNKNQLVGFRR
ncbi:hypothetical protein FRACYDRAFT_239273 [Fragilariopsis cylindrus CCMP1102]|uniref:Uncharacterized protein n=1 Tax=Fragilariopsis cylindrus CCMP1102 TaxID=635003 RepID=A0A1E7FES8_9STRA|nr:hypothetical protein FRACYDRAFT_239273 [Fragilariopsis cylindrus CCMP1102]|eukprot:OEU16678.1 hypothetical protein FRACYDRAFT_239273 [Fragilariopsis cylindrus CCMP1102]